MSLTLLYSPLACSLVPLITLNEAGADFEVRPINQAKQENLSADYRRINPKGKVPVLLIDGKPLTENVAIQIWIARQFPQAQLLPTDSDQQIQAISLMAWFASGIHAHITPINRTKRYCDLPGAEDNVRQLGTKLLVEDMAIMDERLAGRTWFFDHFTAVDAYFFWCYRRPVAFREKHFASFANCQRHFETMQEHASVQKAQAFEQQVLAEFAKQA
jgi:glutathione S-transferase